MSDIKKDIQEIEDFLKSPSPLGKFERMKAPEYELLKVEVENSGRILQKAQYVASMRAVEHKLACAKFDAFVQGVELPKKKIEAIEADIQVFISELKDGVWL